MKVRGDSCFDMIPVHRFRVPWRRRIRAAAAAYSSESGNNSDPFYLSESCDLIRRQQWRPLRFLTPSLFLQQLYDLNAPYDVLLQYFKWSKQEFQLSHSLQHYCKLFYVLANANMYAKLRSLLDDNIIIISKHSCFSILRMLDTLCDNVCANSIIVDLLLLAYVKNSVSDLGLEAFDRAADYGLKLSLTSCNQLIRITN